MVDSGHMSNFDKMASVRSCFMLRGMKISPNSSHALVHIAECAGEHRYGSRLEIATLVIGGATISYLLLCTAVLCRFESKSLV